MNENYLCDNCGDMIRADEIPELPILCVSCGMARERQADLQPVWDGLAEMDPAGLSGAELDVLARHANTPAIRAAALAEIERRLPGADDLPF